MTFENYLKNYLKKGSNNLLSDFAFNYLRVQKLNKTRPDLWPFLKNPKTLKQVQLNIPFGAPPRVKAAAKKMFEIFLKETKGSSHGKKEN